MGIENILLALGLTVIAGLSTGIGSLMAFFMRKTNAKLLSAILGFSAGVMIYVSMAEILPESKTILINSLGHTKGSWVSAASFFAGILLIGIIDKIIPSFENPHEVHKVEEMQVNYCYVDSKKLGKLTKAGFLTAVAIAVHNFPEGIATFISAIKDPNIGIPIALAVAIHNIPEGIAVSVPIYCGTGDKKRALLYSFLSGLSEPLGAIMAYLFLMPFISEQLYGIMFAMVSGIMIFISLDELLPTAQEYGEHHISTYGLVLGMAVMAISLLLFI